MRARWSVENLPCVKGASHEGVSTMRVYLGVGCTCWGFLHKEARPHMRGVFTHCSEDVGESFVSLFKEPDILSRHWPFNNSNGYFCERSFDNCLTVYFAAENLKDSNKMCNMI